MGTLVAWHYPTTLFMKLADHTYVACGNGGKAWSCWGGKTGGRPLRSGTGSTLRANAIAEPNEKANIKCYLINGVCHQCANRILLPAGITVRGAKGYWVSDALYGTYGRPKAAFGFCPAPFFKHPGLSGDLPACSDAAPGGPAGEAAESMRLEGVESGEGPGMASYLERVQARYQDAETEILEAPAQESMAVERRFQVSLFELMVDFRLDSTFAETGSGQDLLEARVTVEDRREKLEAEFLSDGMPVQEFVRRYNDLIEEFQYQSADVLPEDGYESLFDEPRGEAVVLGDPVVAAEAYRVRPFGGEHFDR